VSAPPKEARVLATFGGDVKDSVGGVAVSCASCDPADPASR